MRLGSCLTEKIYQNAQKMILKTVLFLVEYDSLLLEILICCQNLSVIIRIILPKQILLFIPKLHPH